MFKRRAFTLIELLVVVAIIGILAMVVIINVSGVRRNAINTKVRSDVIMMAKAYRLAVASGGGATIDIVNTDYMDPIDGVDLGFVDDRNVSVLPKVPEHPIKDKDYMGKIEASDYLDLCSSGSKYLPCFSFLGELAPGSNLYGNPNPHVEAYGCSKIGSNLDIRCGYIDNGNSTSWYYQATVQDGHIDLTM